MIIQHNIMAINSHRQLGINNTNLGKNLEKLSSGYRINRAADDAAGLAISEKMRAQITGLNRAVLNAQDGSSLIQTAEGALQEVHGMLNRMVELATQSANGTIQADDRQKIESELTALKDEIDRISQATNFNGIKLLDGSLATGGANAAVRGIDLGNIKFSNTSAVNGLYTTTAALATDASAGVKGEYMTTKIEMGDGTSFRFDFMITEKTGDSTKTVLRAADGTEYDIADATGAAITQAEYANALEDQLNKNDFFRENFFITKTGATGTFTFAAKAAGSDAPSVASMATTAESGTKAENDLLASYTDVTVTEAPLAADAFKTVANGDMKTANFNDSKENIQKAVFEVNGQKFAYINTTGMSTDPATQAEQRAKLMEQLGSDVNIVEVATKNTVTTAEVGIMAKLISDKTGLDVRAVSTNLEFRIPTYGDKVGAGGLTMQVGDTAHDYQKITVSVDDMSVKGLGVANISMGDQSAAAASLDKIKAAIEKVSVNRGNLGALQNRLEHTINNLNVTSENMTAAESRIRDVDMAKEMMAFTKNNVLAQAAQAMLAQANQQPQQVLQLLR